MSKRPAPGRKSTGGKRVSVTEKRKISYEIRIHVRNNCATAVVHRSNGSWSRPVGRVSWRCESEDKSVLIAQGFREAEPIIIADQRKLGLRPPVVPPFTG